MSHAVAYKTKPNFEHKAARELESLGVNAVVPFDDSGKRKRVTAPGYVFAGRPVSCAFLKHVRHEVGRVRPSDLANLYVFKPRRRAEESCPYVVGQTVYKGEVAAKVLEIRGRTCIIETVLLGKAHSQAIPYAQLRPG